MSDSSKKCTQWATADEQRKKYVSQQKQGYALAILGGCYLFGAFASSRTIRPTNTMALIIASAVAMGTGIPLARRNDDSQAFDTQTQNLLTTGWISIVVPLVFAKIFIPNIVMVSNRTAKVRPLPDGAVDRGDV